MGAIYLGSL